MSRSVLMDQPTWRVVLFCVVGAGLLTAGVLAGVMRPVQEARRQDALLAEEAEQKAEQAETLRAELAKVNADHDAVLAELNRHRIDLGDAALLNRRIVALIELARECGLEVVQLQPGGQRPAEHYDLLRLRLEAMASPEQHAGFLQTLHAAFPDMSVVGLDLTEARRERLARARGVYGMVWFTAKPDTGASATAAVPVGP